MTRSSPLWQLTLARLREFYRQPEAVFWVYFFPILMVLALGIAFRGKPIEKFTVDVESTTRSDEIVAWFKNDARIDTGTFSELECRNRLRTGKSDLYVRAGEESGTLEYFLDPAKPGSLVAKDAVDRLVQQANGRADPVDTTVVEFDEPGGRYVDFLIPGLLGMGLMGGGLWGVGFAVVDMRIRKLLKRFLATPMKRTQFLMGIMLSRMFFMVPEIILLIAFSWLCFGFLVYGNWGTIVFLVLLGAIEFSGVGLLVACRAKTLESVSGLMNLVMLPMWTLCGIFFSYERFPEFLHPFIKLLPLTPLIDSLRSVMVEGSALISLWPEVVIMSCWSAATFALALWWFRWGD